MAKRNNSNIFILEDVENFTINKVWRKNDNFWIYGLINTFAMLTHPNFAPVSNQNWIKIHDKITIEIKKRKYAKYTIEKLLCLVP